MQPQSRLNPSEEDTLLERLYELEMKNSQLQALVVELLDKNQRLRSELARFEEKVVAKPSP
jgi:predicted RNase H-like nuclease (RuvC/YqgF family)